ncbi:4-hydroxybenzoate octaprenyltransferase [Rickettsiales bacterium Ac37b]|nr:4-hydroxybenzoate octaprenyltransferase [Rickettsiales bacterium Ac37b]
MYNNINAQIDKYYRLFRLHQPAGIAPLLWPGIWAITFASNHLPDIKLLIVFIVGSIIMRAAGCILNDIADRDFDSLVTRTCKRPLACGEISIWQAFGAFIILVILSFILILLTLNKYAILIAISSIIPVIIYPFMKRVTYWPQAFLGITFNWGVLVGWVAVQQQFTFNTFILYITCICWTLGYDTIYAHQDKVDDILVGIKSTAIRFGENTKKWLTLFYSCVAGGLVSVGYLSNMHYIYYIGFIPIIYHLYWQIATLDINDAYDCRLKFISNIGFGLIVFTTILCGKIYGYAYY